MYIHTAFFPSGTDAKRTSSQSFGTTCVIYIRRAPCIRSILTVARFFGLDGGTLPICGLCVKCLRHSALSLLQCVPSAVSVSNFAPHIEQVYPFPFVFTANCGADNCLGGGGSGSLSISFSTSSGICPFSSSSFRLFKYVSRPRTESEKGILLSYLTLSVRISPRGASE